MRSKAPTTRNPAKITDAMNAPTPSPVRPRASLPRRLLAYALVLLAVFLLGWMPMWLQARSRAAELDAAHRDIRGLRLENTLGAAALLARRGEYAEAREAASRFFTQAREDVDNATSPLPEPQREALRAALSERDELIALLARNDPASAERLANVYAAYREAVARSAPNARASAR